MTLKGYRSYIISNLLNVKSLIRFHWYLQLNYMLRQVSSQYVGWQWNYMEPSIAGSKYWLARMCIFVIIVGSKYWLARICMFLIVIERQRRCFPLNKLVRYIRFLLFFFFSFFQSLEKIIKIISRLRQFLFFTIIL